VSEIAGGNPVIASVSEAIQRRDPSGCGGSLDRFGFASR
jgi:hypothetical protein